MIEEEEQEAAAIVEKEAEGVEVAVRLLEIDLQSKYLKNNFIKAIMSNY